MERGDRRSQRRKIETQNGFYQIASQAECATAFRDKTCSKVSSTMNFFSINTREQCPSKLSEQKRAMLL